jgi:hypothetical protein
MLGMSILLSTSTDSMQFMRMNSFLRRGKLMSLILDVHQHLLPLVELYDKD